MEIKYSVTFSRKSLEPYSVGTVNVLSGYALQIFEMSPRLKEGKLAPGEKCMILFGITKEEYDLKDSDQSALDDLAAKMRQNVPADRLIAMLVMDLTNKPVKKALQLQTGESIDNGAFIAKYRVQAGPIDDRLVAARKLQDLALKKDAAAAVRSDWDNARKAVGEALLNMECVYTPDDTALRPGTPYVRDGRVEVFTLLQRAEKARERAKILNLGEDAWNIRQIKKDELGAFLDRCAEMGLNGLRIDGATLDVQMFIKDLSDRPTPRNAALRGCMLQENACGIHFAKFKDTEIKEPERRRITERLLTLQNFTRRELGRSILWTVCMVQGNTQGKLCTKDAKDKLDGAPGHSVIDGKICVVVTRKLDNKKCIAVFTSEIRAAAFAEKINGNPYPVAVTFDDLVQRTNEAKVDGIMVDVDDIGLTVLKDQFERVLKLRDLPPQVVRLKAPETKPEDAEKAEEAAKAVQVAETASLPDPDLGGLPDPDAAGVPVKSVESDPEQSPETELPDEKEDKKERGGFFRRLFGKK